MPWLSAVNAGWPQRRMVRAVGIKDVATPTTLAQMPRGRNIHDLCCPLRERTKNFVFCEVVEAPAYARNNMH